MMAICRYSHPHPFGAPCSGKPALARSNGVIALIAAARASSRACRRWLAHNTKVEHIPSALGKRTNLRCVCRQSGGTVGFLSNLVVFLDQLPRPREFFRLIPGVGRQSWKESVTWLLHRMHCFECSDAAEAFDIGSHTLHLARAATAPNASPQ